MCLERYDEDQNQPKILPCDGTHEICLACLNLVRISEGAAFLCPVCRQEIPSDARINTNRGLLAALALIKANAVNVESVSEAVGGLRVTQPDAPPNAAPSAEPANAPARGSSAAGAFLPRGPRCSGHCARGSSAAVAPPRQLSMAHATLFGSISSGASTPPITRGREHFASSHETSLLERLQVLGNCYVFDCECFHSFTGAV